VRAIERSSTFTPASGPVDVLEEEAAVVRDMSIIPWW